eukprot:m.143450 g.143450  ORF g.143450 m.143450 type:complete len:160 (+) comp14092_c1_seq1:107-586(+)
MPTENRAVTPHHYAQGNYRGRHDWKATEKVVGFGPQTTVYEPTVDKDSDPLETGRTVFISKGEQVVHYSDKTSSHIDRAPTEADATATRTLPQVSRWRGPQVREAKVETFNPWQTSANAHYSDPATRDPPPKEPNKPYYSSTKFTTMDNATGRVNFVAK